ncbi:O-linked N-acetylglucosamine transferase, SPINDLY family protein [Nostoc sp. 'Peltigera membranacea cyanobiont' 210A]|uniref:O-linked N-acetylglucosamine transferase, SPINDLY family protein n=1 Tax=Nostoc sp. 'Peltigera membranacea cyanobiont' 210A TaxID=2014529 RepID=UPI000B956DCB|nr:O-linked N-acetylglucosamine transferase, SPINDLY family protein [Nostoc sp. 'Peltigera membranacea cyanobiont' 210A]OYD97814.1 O-linked N-acetylglucosamine transferase, SPINDLY family protein [Nostoc sp. 'Peltigera membranacea cyanobiont' 210A]
MITDIYNWQNQAEQYFIEENYLQAAQLYEQAIAIESNTISYYWHLGLLMLLQGQEAEAQMTWMLPMTEADEEQLPIWINELVKFLRIEAERRETLGEYSLAWLIRQHIREINPSYINNLLQILILSIKLQKFEEIDDVNEWGLIESLKAKEDIEINTELLIQVLKELLNTVPLHPINLNLIEASLSYFSNPHQCFSILLPAALKIGHTLRQPLLAACLLELHLRLEPDNVEVLRHLAIFYQDARNYSQGIETARLCYSLSEGLADKIFALHLLLRGLMSAGGYWQEICTTCEELKTVFKQFIEAQPILLEEGRILRLLTPSFAIPHIKDAPAEFRAIHNKVAEIFNNDIQALAQSEGKNYARQIINHQSLKTHPKKLKIGYVSYALRNHSVGWLARWLFQHHNRDKFDIHTYFVNYTLVNDYIQEWYLSQAGKARQLGMNGLEIADQIYQDEIDILIDLDSITLDITSEVMALKPAPIQVTWLGWDASGIPAIDYFIADPYVLPNDAQDYYTEKIWRLPQTYIAVDGFEVGVPTLRRDDLDIPMDAVVYLSAQRGYKRHPETTKWQMQIIKQVPNSYFLIKGLSEEETIKRFFYQIAEEEGVDCSRLRFLPQVHLESVHRANLGIADIVLDTFPYNGATTTLETLWMGIPLVTRVGEQFAARNSYTMMMNAGITEGIAWTDEEYIEWGVRLGKDEALRQQVTLKLKASRQTAPLWNGKQFTREMEKAYEQMWQRYIEGK